jgi:hypothetical protein
MVEKFVNSRFFYYEHNFTYISFLWLMLQKVEAFGIFCLFIIPTSVLKVKFKTVPMLN